MKTLLVGYKVQDLFEVNRRGERRPVPWLDGDITCHKDNWDLIKFKTGPKLMSGELSLDLLQEIHLLHPKRFELEFDGRERDRNDLIAKIKDDPDRVRDFSATWPASVPGGQKLMLTSFPGCFCHRRVDDGGLALAEVVARELSASKPFNSSTLQPFNILDMGCGCGLVGFLVAASHKGDTPVRLVMVDSHTRAVEAAELNAEKLGIPAEVILSDNGTRHLPRDCAARA